MKSRVVSVICLMTVLCLFSIFRILGMFANKRRDSAEPTCLQKEKATVNFGLCIVQQSFACTILCFLCTSLGSNLECSPHYAVVLGNSGQMATMGRALCRTLLWTNLVH